jgi:hypothetical protein
MKKISLIIIMVLLGFASLVAQTTGYVTVKWNECDPCCLTMQYRACITVMRVSDRYIVTEDQCVTVNSSTFEYEFNFPMPSCTSNEEFIVFATVSAFCNPSPLCCHDKNEGVTGSCSDLEEATFDDVWVIFDE